jgi:hypothetical protein
MSTDNGLFNKWADEVRKQMHDFDIRLTKIETCNADRKAYGNLALKIIVALFALAGIIIAYLELKN